MAAADCGPSMIERQELVSYREGLLYSNRAEAGQSRAPFPAGGEAPNPISVVGEGMP